MILRIELPQDLDFKSDDEILIKFTPNTNQVKCEIEHKSDGVIFSSSPTIERKEKTPKSEVTLKEYIEQLRVHLQKNEKYRTAETYDCTLHSFMSFRENQDIALSDITPDIVEDYESFLKLKGLSLNTISFYMRRLRAIYNKAVEAHIVIHDQKPFARAFTSTTKTSKRAIPLRTIRKLAQAELKSDTERLARDLFLFSYYTRGMSFVDIAYLKKSDIRNGYLTYKRKKTGQELKIGWRKSMQDIVNRYASLDGEHLLGILDNNGKKSLRDQYHYKQCHINQVLKRISKRMKLHTSITMYVARHSWATIAKEKNIPLSIICDGMGHNSEKTTQIYLRSINAAIIDKSNDILIQAITKQEKK